MSRSFTTITDAGAESNTTVDNTFQKNMNKDVEKSEPWEDLRRVDSCKWIAECNRKRKKLMNNEYQHRYGCCKYH